MSPRLPDHALALGSQITHGAAHEAPKRCMKRRPSSTVYAAQTPPPVTDRLNDEHHFFHSTTPSLYAHRSRIQPHTTHPQFAAKRTCVVMGFGGCWLMERAMFGEFTCSPRPQEFDIDRRTLQPPIHLASGLQVDFAVLDSAYRHAEALQPRSRRLLTGCHPSYSLDVDYP
ncbi:hypothetical protein BC629DRAFT_4181 [Irpex lacteus]|nr:hypothetical protein BC629DRAFT_4181 [Irpex lacteus]